ncbi:Probable RNA-directed DNA polymerase from transposon BS [Eumeta japonica]|uniref:Probable RNA-directed DNA polymerase from transposon BS n=1 Tax=Eumeta variegata TaxID=151549 RepID=A0A4C1YHL1_EUMVA|nr:Probable RNA-directed DNA polymerase from transposon BS [Eumeta japonica]
MARAFAIAASYEVLKIEVFRAASASLLTIKLIVLCAKLHKRLHKVAAIVGYCPGRGYRHLQEVIGIYKPGKPRDLSASYRPIILLSGLNKLFEKILKTRLSDHFLGKGLIIDERFGFRPAHSCPQQVLRLVEYVSEGFETERSTVGVFFDVAKAFDRVWHAGLIYKLYSFQVPDRLIIIIQNYLANRHFTFRHERTHSTRRLIKVGVPQGSTLSPLLYSA